jgi:Fe2+ or Zn2+ uptake regulation protein
VVQFEVAAEHHDHFVCEQCHNVVRVPCSELLIAQRSLEHVDTVDRHAVVFFGVCDRCAALRPRRVTIG